MSHKIYNELQDVYYISNCCFPWKEYKFPLNREKSYSATSTEDKNNEVQRIELNMSLGDTIYCQE